MTRALAESTPDLVRAAFAARAMSKPLRSLKRETAGVRRNQDIECVHRMRVASRRLRNALILFADVLPTSSRTRWQKRLKGVTKALGEARDLDVQMAFLQQFLGGLDASGAEHRPGIEHLLAIFVARRGAAQADVLQALDRLNSSRTLKALADWIQDRALDAWEKAANRAPLRSEADRAVRHCLGDLFAYEPYVERPDAVEELHAMRIAAKHLRYTLEAYAPLFEDELATHIQWGRRLQDWLGEIHDCDVWQVELGKLLADLPERPRRSGRRLPVPDRLRPGIEHLRQERTQRRARVYEEFRSAWRNAGATGYWEDFRRPFMRDQPSPVNLAHDPRAGRHESATPANPDNVAGSPLESAPKDLTRGSFNADERLTPVLALARSCRYEVEHTHQVTHLALRLFAALAGLHSLDDERRSWLMWASLLHDIGWLEGRKAHHRTALRLILESPLLPWDERVRRIVGLVARYHRKALPREDDEHFAALSAADRADVRKLAAILRIADALDYSHTCAVEDVRCRVTGKRISIRCIAGRPAEVECARAVEKGDLAAQVFDKEVSVTWRLR